MKNLHTLLLVTLFSGSLQAQVLEDFESGNIESYIVVSGANLNVDVNQTSAYECNLGAEFSAGSASWYYQTDAVVAPGNKLSAFFRLNANTGRVYVGFGASAAGCWSAVLGANTNEILIQQNADFGYAVRAQADQVYTPGVWYLAEIDWAADGMVTFNLFDELGLTLLSSAGPVQGPTSQGGIAFRGFGSAEGSASFDNYRIGDPEPNSYCSGEFSSGICPCGNFSDGSLGSGAGCANSTGTAGALLGVTGSTSLSVANLRLNAIGLPPNSAGLYFQGSGLLNDGAGDLFGDGLLCAGGSVQRLQVVFADVAGSSSTSVNIVAAGALVAPGPYWYQLWYRDNASLVCGSGFNTSNGLRVCWRP